MVDYIICVSQNVNGSSSFSQGLLSERHYQELRLCPWGHVLSGEQHNEDKLQEVSVREMPCCGHEA